MSDVWLVQLPSGEKKMTLDELDAAYQSDRIDERTLVREPGAPWRSLGSLLGIEPQVHQSVRPVSIDLELDTPPFQSHTKRNVLVGVLALGLAGAGVFFAITKFGGHVETAKPLAAAAVAVPAIATTAPAAVPPVADKPVLGDDQKKALTKADREKKARDAKDTKTRKLAPAPKSKPVFTKTSNKYDPLNSKL